MEREEALKELRICQEQARGDREAAHIVADGVLCALLESLGYADVVEAYLDVERWYA